MDARQRGSFASHLRTLRLARGLTQQDLAERSGVSVRSVSDLEREVSVRPHRDTAVMLADGLGLAGVERDVFLHEARGQPRWPAGSSRSALLPLPAPANPLLGRDGQLQDIEEMLLRRRVRFLTLTGTGGVGKTRLAIEAARRLSSHFGDGVVLVRLDGLRDPSLVLPTLASALGLQETAGVSARAQLVTYLASRQILVVLDNLEHLIAASAGIADLLTHTTAATFVITSREALRVRGEHVITVAPLPRPDLERWASQTSPRGEGSPAIDLFVRRALAVRTDLAVDPATREGRDNLAVIAEICHRLDGLPLAIELAAAQAQVLTPAAILGLLQNAGLPLLAGGARDQPSRLQTMDAAIAWSYDLLTPTEQSVFRGLSVFAAGFDLKAASAVVATGASSPSPRDTPVAAGDSLIEAITSLARKNLLVQDTTAPHGAPARFRMLEPLRLFALARLRAAGEEPATRLRHAAYFARAAEELDALTLGPDPEIWLERQALDLDNFRAAQDWALSNGEDALAVHVTAYVAQFWLLRGLHAEGRRRVAAAIAVDAAAPPADRWFLRFWATILAFDSGDVTSAGEHVRQLLDIAEASGDQIGVGAGLTLLSQVVGASPAGHEEAANLARRAVDLLEPLGQDEWTASAWARLGIEHQKLGRLGEARDFLLHSLMLRRRKRCEGCAAYSLVLLGAVHQELGQPQEAADAFRECLALAIKQGNQPLTVRSLLGLADVARQYGAVRQPARPALLFFGASEAVRRRHGFAWDEAGAALAAHWVASIRRAIGEEAVEALIAEGMALPLSAVFEAAQRLQVSRASPDREDRGKTLSLLDAMGSIE